MATILANVPQPLLNDIVTGRCIPIIGAGFSRNAILPSGQKMPLWDELGKTIASLLTDYPYSTPIDAMSAYCYEYSRVKLVEELVKLLHVGSAQPSPAHKAFCELPFDIVCTTNFDFLLEKAYALEPQSVYCRPVIDQEQLSIASSEPGILLIKVHGDLNHPNRLVVTEEDYDTFIERYPLLATYLGNLLITRTPLFIGYSLEDPDFRQIWQVIGNRLGQMRRPAYAVTVSISAPDAARYERRGVKVIDLPGQKSNYGQILETFFNELRNYWTSHLIQASTITEEPLGELSLPKEATTRLCFFAIPLTLHSFYKSSVFPITESFGLVPLTVEGMISPGDNILAKIAALLDRAEVVIADASTPSVLAEIGMAVSRKPTPPRLLVIVEEGSELPSRFEDVRTIVRPRDLSFTPHEFLATLEDWFQKLTDELRPQFSDEPRRLLAKREYRAAVISAVILVETTLLELLPTLDIPFDKDKRRRLTLYQLMEVATKHQLVTNRDLETLREWMAIRNRLVHTEMSIQASQARKIVQGVMRIISNIRQRNR